MIPSPLRCMAKSAQAIDGKGLGSAPLRKRVRNWLKGKGLDTHAAFDGIERTGRLRGEAHGIDEAYIGADQGRL